MALVVLRLHLSKRVQAILKTRDLIFWDQRGVGLSEPHLCRAPDTEWFRNLMLGLSVSDQRRHNLEMFAGCNRERERTNIDMAQFGTATSAKDLDDLRRALAIRQWNLDGGSYGTRLGLVAMRDAPDAIRSAVLDGVLPIDAPGYSAQAWRFARVVELLEARCAEDSVCHARFPDLAARIYRLIAALKDHPFIVSVTPGPNFPADHIVVNDRLISGGLYQAFYDSNLIPLLPAVIEQIERGNDATFEAMAYSILASLGAIRQSLNVAVDCHDAMPLTSVAAIHAENSAFPQLADAFADDESWPSYCANWNPNVASPTELLPTVSSIPTLLLVGDFDPVTPPTYAQRARETLSASTILELPSAGHGGKSLLPCIADVELAFLENPTSPLDLGCSAQFARTHFVVNFLVLPGLTRLFLGLQTHAHIGLIVTAALGILLPIICLIGIVTGSVRRRIRPCSTAAVQFSSPGTLILFASFTSLAAAALLAYDVNQALDGNADVLLLGLPGRPSALIFIALLAGVLSVFSLVVCLLRLGSALRSPMHWLGIASAIAYLCSLVALSVG